jgi:arylsulfatase A-like enzyme
MLDYGFEIEHFDRHLGRMLAELEKRGQLDNTIVVVTSDNGMPFPRAKGNGYEISNHMPLVVMWKNGIRSPGRQVGEFVSFADFAPTFVEAAGLTWDETGMAPASGRSLVDLFQGEGKGSPRDHVLLGQERHDVGRPHDWGYPIRGIVTTDWLYLRNFEPSRWPACDPETGYLNTDGGPTKTEILNAHRRDPGDAHWHMCFGKRPGEELYNLRNDPDCLTNLADSEEHHLQREQLRQKLFGELADQGDPRMFEQGGVFEAEPCAYEEIRNFYERYMSGEKIRAEWVNDSDFETMGTPSLSK